MTVAPAGLAGINRTLNLSRNVVDELEKLTAQIRKEEGNGALFVRAGTMKLALDRAYVMPGSTDIMRLRKQGAISVGDQLDCLIAQVRRQRWGNRPPECLAILDTRNFRTEREVAVKDKARRDAAHEAAKKAETERLVRHNAHIARLAEPGYGACKKSEKDTSAKKGKKRGKK